MSTTSHRTRTRKSPGQRSAEIHEAAVAIASEGGLSVLTLRSVATRAGVAPGLVAHYTDSMDDLVANTFRELTASELEGVREQVDAVEDPAAKLGKMLATVLAPDHENITLVWVDAWSLGRGNAALSAAIEEQMGAWQRFIAGIARQGEDAGVFAPDDHDAVAWQILAMIDGISAHTLTRGADPAPFVARLAQACETLLGAAPGAVTSRLTND